MMNRASLKRKGYRFSVSVPPMVNHNFQPTTLNSRNRKSQIEKS